MDSRYLVNFIISCFNGSNVELKQKLISKIDELLEDDALEKYLSTDEFKRDLHNEKLYEKDSEYFSRKQFPVPDEIDNEVNPYLCKKLKATIGPEVFVCATFVYAKILSEKDMVSPIVSPQKRKFTDSSGN